MHYIRRIVAFYMPRTIFPKIWTIQKKQKKNKNKKQKKKKGITLWALYSKNSEKNN